MCLQCQHCLECGYSEFIMNCKDFKKKFETLEEKKETYKRVKKIRDKM